MLSLIYDLFLIKRTGHSCCLSMKIEVLAYLLGRRRAGIYFTKCCIIKLVVSFLELVTEAIIGIIKINPKQRKL